MQQGLLLKEKEYWESSRNFVKCTAQQIKQPEAGCSLLETRFATSSKNHAAFVISSCKYPAPSFFLSVEFNFLDIPLYSKQIEYQEMI
ncbi:hypothetical protein EKD00_09080 [Chlorobium phaeovibrioides]|uniref:hypothetical protein n=1 Tax=Chlorobium phaeovibrioides TaxID=1094 RepID=UPI000F9DF7C4|nr:hypothetical protein [Chlorobium phaeovibrioides]RTY33710.1 hypothetical protein EKD00_09080 [Chlorobium phaeovibrioides]